MSQTATTEQATPTPAPATPQTMTQRLEAAFKAATPTPEAPPAETPSAPATPEAPAAPAAPTADTKPTKSALTPDAQKARIASIRDAQQRREFAKQRDELGAQLQEHQALKEAVSKGDVWTALKMLNMTPEQFAAKLAEQAPLTAGEQAAARDAAEAKARVAALEARERQVQLDSAQRNVLNFLNKDDSFELTRSSEGGVALVMAVADEIVKAHPDPDSLQGWQVIQDAAQRVERYEEQKLERLAELKKVKAKFAAPVPQTAPQASPSAPREPPRTISGQMSAVTAPAAEMTEEERVKWVADEMKKRFAR